jgi:hypothetical protein
MKRVSMARQSELLHDSLASARSTAAASALALSDAAKLVKLLWQKCAARDRSKLTAAVAAETALIDFRRGFSPFICSFAQRAVLQ